ncbi:cytochrome P450 family protein [Thermostaphylospora chromogena]|uniref:Cytochrome P450 n=1 Tax=Thermostaphylospora chromogena TaxID=35622 RepID=A0A1H0ZTN8_9ACTN|nr:cytochrome P450 [Thermostaphylospora chromogena]SDQ30777.1 Cytochrome P450 [Thermostaphylospora chromogena]
MNERCPIVLDVTGREVHRQAARARELGPATPVELPGGVRAWWVNDYKTAKALLTDPRITKSARAHWPAFRNGEIPPDWELISWVAMDNISTVYGKDHMRLRRLVGKAFTRRRVEAMRPRIVEITKNLIDDLAATDPGEVVDLKSGFAKPLPARLVAHLIGLPEEALDGVVEVIDMMTDTTVSPAQAQAVLAGWRGAMEEFIASKRREPGEDITSHLIAARDDEDGSRLSESELTDTVFAILGAGAETTINFLDNAITELLTHPEQRAMIVRGEKSWDDVIEETLRVQAPLASLPLRFAAEDVELDGVTIRRGDPVLINYHSLGRDPALHHDPERFDITRADKEHLSFGHGPHYCLGAGVARLIGQVSLSMLFDRFPDMALAVAPEELEPMPTFIMNGHRSLPVRLTVPVAAAAAS